MMQQYETTFIVDAHLPDDVIEKTLEKFKKLMEDGGANIHNIDRWGKRRLAYEIARKQYGYYVYIRFEAEGSFIQEMEREFKLEDAILRYLTVVVPVVALKQEIRDEEKRIAEKQEVGDSKKPKVTPPAETDADSKKAEGSETSDAEAEAPAPDVEGTENVEPTDEKE